ncbi:hypothetical protein FP76_gp166 [Bacillus phage Evoli]|uniref:Uncharacterized protein n=1 Tax=Bacillus phage Evoli TaxID=1486658 RepID=A0A024B1Q7_9CAUD|nr:hypothetical protein FP76_gp166 [Bacillus phage Evoli]AHZ09928.1 hypothetical protein [Bacillus phage Evoli]
MYVGTKTEWITIILVLLALMGSVGLLIGWLIWG